MDGRNEYGFTLVEVVVAACILVLFMGGLYQAISLGLSMWDRGETQIDEQQNVRIAINHIARELRTASSFNIGAKGSSIEMIIPCDEVIPDYYPTVRYYFDGGNEIQRSASGGGHNIVAYGIKSIRFSANPQGNSVTIDIKGRSGYHLKTQVYVRVLNSSFPASSEESERTRRVMARAVI